jgi:hypothetical protein
MDVKKTRTSIKDIRTDRASLKKKAGETKSVGEKLVMDRKQLDDAKKFIQSTDMPSEEKTRAISNLERQQTELNKTFEKDVERPSKEHETKMKELSQESSKYAENARKNKEKLDGFKRESSMDDSGIKRAGREQTARETEYRAERQAIEQEKKSQENDVRELKRKATKS